MPDIDTDFPDDKRDEVINYVIEKYGKRRVCGIVTFGTLGAKQAIRDVGRILNVPIYKIELKDGWVIEVVSSHHPEVIDLNKNDKIQVKAKIYETSYYLTLADYVVDVDKSVYDEVEISIVE